MKKPIYVLLLIAASASVYGQHISQWRGAVRNGTYQESNLLGQWPEEGPELIWYNEDIGTGHSSASVTGDRVYVTGREENKEYLSSFDLKGNLQWKVSYGNRWQGSFPDVRSTPNVKGDRVYVVSGMAEVVCLDAYTGHIRWSVDAREKFKGIPTLWGFCESPLLIDDMVIFTPGGKVTHMVALHGETGETLWTSESLPDSVGYVSPIAFDHHGRKIIASISANFFFGIDAASGNLLWKFNYRHLSQRVHPVSPIINVNTPLYYNGEIYISKGYNHDGVKFTIADNGQSIEQVWSDTIMDVHLGGMVLRDGYLYGSNWIHNSDGNWCCLDWSTGRLMYETHWENKGSVIWADGKLYCFEEKRGNMALVEPTPEGFNIISTFKTSKGSGPAWAHPVIRDGILYIRRGKALMAYDIGS